MPHEFLAHAPVVRTTSFEQARAAVERVYLPHTLRGWGERLDMRLNAVPESRLSLGYLTYGAETELDMPATGTCYHVNLDVAGTTRAYRHDGQDASTAPRTSGTVLLPNARTRVRWAPDAEQLILKVDRSSLESHLADLLGEPVSEVVGFDFELDLTSGAGRSLLRAVEFFADELGGDADGGLAASPLARQQLESFVLTQLLMAGRHQFTDVLHGHQERRRLGRLAPVLAHIDAHAGEDLSPQVLARVGLVSVRTLHAEFQARLGESPMAYVRRVRLGRVRAELVDADPAEVRVTDVATRWGFFHASRFAQQYREAFGELPSVTLSR